MELVTLTGPNDRAKVVSALHDFAQAQSLPATVLQAMDLALEEHLTNVLNYSYEAGDQMDIQVKFEKTGGVFLVEVTDNGKAYNPLERPEPDLSIPLEDRPIGGLGVYLMRQFTDELIYRRENERNILQMRKRLDAT
jgi:anti-sigma regulatory factor (Ser/Thr protein kinase)